MRKRQNELKVLRIERIWENEMRKRQSELKRIEDWKKQNMRIDFWKTTTDFWREMYYMEKRKVKGDK